MGLVASLNRPGCNITGVTQPSVQLVVKRLGLLHELFPSESLAFLLNPNNPDAAPQPASWRRRAPASGSQLARPALPVARATSKPSSRQIAQARAAGLSWAPDACSCCMREEIGALALHHAIPPSLRSYSPGAGGSRATERASRMPIAGSASIPGEFSRVRNPPICRSAAHKIRAGDQPQDRQGTRPRVPPTLLARADEVIE